MKARQAIGSAGFPPDVLRIIYDAFDDAWAELSPEISARPAAIESARISLASIVLGLAKSAPIDRAQLKTEAIEAFRRKHRLTRM